MKSVHLGPAVTGDLDAIRGLLTSSGLPLAGLADQCPEGFVVARSQEDHDAVVGCAGLEVYGPAGLLRSVVVTADARSRGVGSALVGNRLELARHLGLEVVYLLTTTAAQFFQRVGFVFADRPSPPAEIARSPEFAHACPASAACLKFDLSSATGTRRP